jgi:hypothetical protein
MRRTSRRRPAPCAHPRHVHERGKRPTPGPRSSVSSPSRDSRSRRVNSPGVAALRDLLSMSDNGAIATASFIDCGLPSTVKHEGPRVRRAFRHHAVGTQRARPDFCSNSETASSADTTHAQHPRRPEASCAARERACSARTTSSERGAASASSNRWGNRPDVISGPVTDNAVGTRYNQRRAQDRRRERTQRAERTRAPDRQLPRPEPPSSRNEKRASASSAQTGYGGGRNSLRLLLRQCPDDGGRLRDEPHRKRQARRRGAPQFWMG